MKLFVVDIFLDKTFGLHWWKESLLSALCNGQVFFHKEIFKSSWFLSNMTSGTFNSCSNVSASRKWPAFGTLYNVKCTHAGMEKGGRMLWMKTTWWSHDSMNGHLLICRWLKFAFQSCCIRIFTRFNPQYLAFTCCFLCFCKSSSCFLIVYWNEIHERRAFFPQFALYCLDDCSCFELNIGFGVAVSNHLHQIAQSLRTSFFRVRRVCVSSPADSHFWVRKQSSSPTVSSFCFVSTKCVLVDAL